MAAPTVRRRQLGGQLRKLREESDFTLAEVEARTSVKETRLSRIETARLGIKAGDLDELLDLYRVEDRERRDFLHTLAREGSRRGWWQTYSDVLSTRYMDLITLEADAKQIRTVQISLIPGLLQTSAYARGIIEVMRLDETATTVDALVEVRIARQNVLTRPQPLSFWAVIHEAALRPRFASQDTMREQLQRLIDLSRLPNVNIQILPAEAAPGPWMGGQFNILTFPAPGDDIVLTEDFLSTTYIEDEGTVTRYGEAFQKITAEALPLDASLAFIAKQRDMIL
ncbi:helix-turn-helix domain-containing protein [Streptomyces sp. NPDC092296]|uniref:helix-turn-helix domain-containing protein n=1 Tax=Streptomyces sp. NPDC092296 TaxID=3366012 RepID=UPI00380589BC